MARDDEDATAAVRERSPELLKAAFQRVTDEESERHPWDSRDVMLRLTPFVDCGRRLGLDPPQVLGPIAHGGAAWSDGPAYRFAWPKFSAKD